MKRDLRSSAATSATSSRCSSAVDGGADALLEVGLQPDVIVGDMDSVSDEALRCGAELVVHAYAATATRPAPRGSSDSALPYHAVAAPGISEDLALLLAYEKGAELIVAVGTHLNLIEFLERDRAGMSSTFVTRLKVGEILVDAKGVSRLVSRRVGVWPLVVFALAAFGAIVTAVLGVAAAPARDRARQPADPEPARALAVPTLSGTARAARAARGRLGLPRGAVQPSGLVARNRRRAAGPPRPRAGRALADRGENRPSLFRRPNMSGTLLVLAVEPYERFAFQLTGERLDAELRLVGA